MEKVIETDSLKTKVFITGATGFIGRALIDSLDPSKYSISAVCRSSEGKEQLAAAGVTALIGDSAQAGKWQKLCSDADIVINLAGESIVGRWTAAKKEKIYLSRIRTTRRVSEAINAASKPITLISTSAIGIYPNSLIETYDEFGQNGTDFLAKVCADWEKEASKSIGANKHCIILRLGNVLSNKGGFLSPLLPIFKKGLGGPIASGKQWFSWIHLDDVLGVFEQLCNDLTDNNSLLEGRSDSRAAVFNLTAPIPVLNKTFTATLGRALSRPAFIPVPKQILKLRFGEFAETIASSQRVLPRRLIDRGFEFTYEDLESALREITCQ